MRIRRRKTILYVDDDPHSRMAMQTMLREGGYGVKVASSGADALKILGAGGIDLIACDLEMPQMNGHEVLVRAKELVPETPRVLFTGKILVYSPQRAVDLFVSKGEYSPEILLERIGGFFARKSEVRRKTDGWTRGEAHSNSEAQWRLKFVSECLKEKSFHAVCEAVKKSSELFPASQILLLDIIREYQHRHRTALRRGTDRKKIENLYCLALGFAILHATTEDIFRQLFSKRTA